MTQKYDEKAIYGQALDKAMGIIAVGTEYIMKYAETRALKMVEEIWSAIEEIFASNF